MNDSDIINNLQNFLTSIDHVKNIPLTREAVGRARAVVTHAGTIRPLVQDITAMVNSLQFTRIDRAQEARDLVAALRTRIVDIPTLNRAIDLLAEVEAATFGWFQGTLARVMHYRAHQEVNVDEFTQLLDRIDAKAAQVLSASQLQSRVIRLGQQPVLQQPQQAPQSVQSAPQATVQSSPRALSEAERAMLAAMEPPATVTDEQMAQFAQANQPTPSPTSAPVQVAVQAPQPQQTAPQVLPQPQQIASQSPPTTTPSPRLPTLPSPTQAPSQVVVQEPQQQITPRVVITPSIAQSPSPSLVSVSQPVSGITPPRNIPVYTDSDPNVQEGRRFAQVGFLRYKNKNLTQTESRACLEYLFNTRNMQEIQERYRTFIRRPIGQMGLLNTGNDFLRNTLGLDLSFSQRTAISLARSAASATSLLPENAIKILNKLMEQAGISLSASS